MTAAEDRAGAGRWWLHGAGILALAGYVGLAVIDARGGPVLVGLGLAWGAGWLAVALAGSRAAEGRPIVLGWAIAFRLVGLVTTPTWEDDYHRYLWDGYALATTGNPYAEAPSAAFGREDVPAAMQTALDGINHPELPTIYGPTAQLVFGLGALIAPGEFWVLKALLIVIELSGWWALRRWLKPAGWVLALWCPLLVMELAFAGHPEAIGLAAVAWAIAADRTGRPIRAAGALALGVAAKAFAWALTPFWVVRGGWRSALAGVVVVGACYLPFLAQGGAAEWPAVRAMGTVFEYNSIGFAVLQAALGNEVARKLAPGLALVGCALIFARWWRRGRPEDIPGAEIFGVMLLFSPVVNPWYALWLLPFLALRPQAWGVGVLAAVPLAYVHGFNLPGQAELGYQHPVWVRPLEVAVVLAAVAVGRWRAADRG